MPPQSKSLLCNYRYDPLDRLVANALPDEPERQRFYCKSRLATEIHGATAYSIIQHEDQLLAQQRSEGDVREPSLLATDKQRSVLQSQRANQPGQPFVYSPYGHRPIANGLLSLLGFNGERSYPVTGWYLLGNGYRSFNAVLMCFTSPDSWSPFGVGGRNPYAYCLGEPVNNSDTSGHVVNPFKLKTQTMKWKAKALNKAPSRLPDNPPGYSQADHGKITPSSGKPLAYDIKDPLEASPEGRSSQYLQNRKASSQRASQEHSRPNNQLKEEQLINEVQQLIGQVQDALFDYRATIERTNHLNRELIESRMGVRLNQPVLDEIKYFMRRSNSPKKMLEEIRKDNAAWRVPRVELGVRWRPF